MRGGGMGLVGSEFMMEGGWGVGSDWEEVVDQDDVWPSGGTDQLTDPPPPNPLSPYLL